MSRIQVRMSAYRGKAGFTISGTSARGHHVKVFTLTRTSADRIAKKLRAGEDIEIGDFEP